MPGRYRVSSPGLPPCSQGSACEQGSRSRYLSGRTLLHFIAGLIALSAVLHADNQKSVKGPQSPPQQKPADLIWPLPPDPPRIRWLREFADLAKVKKPVARKGGLLERLTGTKTIEERLELRKPYGIAIDRRKRIYAADTELSVVFVIDAASHTVDVLRGTSHAPLSMPVGLAVDVDDRLFVSDAELHSITVYSPAGQAISHFGTAQLQRPGGMAIDRDRHRLYVADAKAGHIAVFDTKTLAATGYVGAPSAGGKQDNGTFFGPSNVAVDRSGYVYVADTLNCRVQIFDTNGRFVRAFGTQGDRPGEFIRPKGIALDSEGHVYVADAEFNNFQILTPEGQPLLAVGNLGTERGQFALLAGLFIDEEDQIYTTEMFHRRIQVFQYIPQPGSSREKGGAGGNDR